MEPVSIAIGIAAGLAIGGGAGMMLSGKAKLQSELDAAKREREKAQKALQSGEKKAEEAAKKAKELEEKLEKTKKSLKDTESAKKKKEEEASSTKKALEKAEGKAKQLEGKAKAAEKTAAEKDAAVDQLKKDLAKAGSAPAAKFEDVAGDLDGILKVLCQHEGQEAAVLADSNGIVVAAFGDNAVKEGMAAATARITKISDQLRGIVEFGTVSAFRIRDTDEHVIAGRTVDIHGDRVALATVGSKVPSDQSLDGAIASLHAALA